VSRGSPRSLPITATQPGTAGIRDAFEQVSALVIASFSNPRHPISRRQSLGPANLSGIINAEQTLGTIQGADDNQPWIPGEGSDDGAWEALQAILFDQSNAFMSLQRNQPGMLGGSELKWNQQGTV
jgi:hypothetical protein